MIGALEFRHSIRRWLLDVLTSPLSSFKSCLHCNSGLGTAAASIANCWLLHLSAAASCSSYSARCSVQCPSSSQCICPASVQSLQRCVSRPRPRGLCMRAHACRSILSSTFNPFKSTSPSVTDECVTDDCTIANHTNSNHGTGESNVAGERSATTRNQLAAASIELRSSHDLMCPTISIHSRRPSW